jgi:hypothetical protein
MTNDGIRRYVEMILHRKGRYRVTGAAGAKHALDFLREIRGISTRHDWKKLTKGAVGKPVLLMGGTVLRGLDIKTYAWALCQNAPIEVAPVASDRVAGSHRAMLAGAPALEAPVAASARG